MAHKQLNNNNPYCNAQYEGSGQKLEDSDTCPTVSLNIVLYSIQKAWVAKRPSITKDIPALAYRYAM